MLAIYRQDMGSPPFGQIQHEGPRQNQGLLVGHRHILARLQRGPGAVESSRTHNRRNHKVMAGAAHFSRQGVRPYHQFAPCWQGRPVEGSPGGLIGNGHPIRPVDAGLFHQKRCVGMPGNAGHLDVVGKVFGHIQSVDPDRAGGSHDGDAPWLGRGIGSGGRGFGDRGRDGCAGIHCFLKPRP